MERNSTNENFEHFLRQNAEDFRIYPSDKVWEGISQNLHKPKKRYPFGLILLLVSSSLIGYTVFELASNTGKPETVLTKPNLETTAPATVIPSPTTAALQTNKAGNNELEKLIVKEGERPVNSQLYVASLNKDAKPLEGQWSASLFSILTNRNSLTPENLNQKPLFELTRQKLNELSDRTETTNKLSKSHAKSNRFSLMFFFTPTVSYRKLTENKSYLRSSNVGAPYSYAALYDINNAVTHKPDIGLEFGATTKYALTKSIKLRAGVQFNINRYDIKAFKYVPEVATIALNNGSRVDSLNTVSSYRNFNGGKTDWLQNFYFQVSTPIGVEVKLHGDEKMHIGVASTIQPTYVIGDRAYLITADYKNYAQVPWLIRRWNVNTNLETFVAYSSGKINWQIGPQVRYQLLSSFISKYPVKENLFDFGLKVGISLNQHQ